jgi:hypothetical protein
VTVAKKKIAREPAKVYWWVYVAGYPGGTGPVAYIHSPDEAAALAKARKAYWKYPAEAVTVQRDQKR